MHHVMVVLAYKDPRYDNHADTILDGVEWDVTDYNSLIVLNKNGRVVKTYSSHEWESITTVGLEVKQDNTPD